MKGESNMAKSRFVNTIKIGFILFDRGYELVIYTLTSSITNSFGRSMVHTNVNISN